MNNIFDLINPDLFSALTSADKRNNYLLLVRIYAYFDEGNFKSYVYKDELVQHLIAFMRKNKIKIKEEDEENNFSSKAYREYVFEKIRYFKKLGWLDEETDKEWQTIIILYDTSLHLLSTLQQVANIDSNNVEQSGYVFSIYNALKSLKFSEENSVMVIEQVSESARNLRNSLAGLSSNIKRFIDRLMNDKTSSPSELLKVLFDEYHHKVIVKSFNNLKTRENPEKYSNFIINTLYSLIEDKDKFSALNANYIAVKTIVNPSAEELTAIEAKLEKMIYEVITTFEGIRMAIEAIESQNTKFLSATEARLKYLVNKDVDLEGQINELLKRVEQAGEGFEFDHEINLSSFGQVDDFSLYLPRKNRAFDYEDAQPLSEVTAEEKAKAISENPLFSEFSKKAIFAFGEELLTNKENIKINEINVTGEKIVLKLLLLKVYEYDEKCTYKISNINEKVVIDDIELTNFIIERKGDYYEL